jgi:hypothetical protein
MTCNIMDPFSNISSNITISIPLIDDCNGSHEWSFLESIAVKVSVDAYGIWKVNTSGGDIGVEVGTSHCPYNFSTWVSLCRSFLVDIVC